MDDGRLVTEEPMDKLKNGTKRLRVAGARPPAALPQTPFVLLAREPAANGGGETWVGRGWRPEMTAHFAALGATPPDVVGLDPGGRFRGVRSPFCCPPHGGSVGF